MWRFGSLNKLGKAVSKHKDVRASYIHWWVRRSISSTCPVSQADIGLTAEQQEFKEVAHEFARKELLPYAAKWDRSKHFPVDTLRAAAQLGFGGIFVGDDVGTFYSGKISSWWNTARLGMISSLLRSFEVPVQYDAGGSSLGRADAAVIFEALASGDISVTAYLTIHNMVANCIDKYVVSGIELLHIMSPTHELQTNHNDITGHADMGLRSSVSNIYQT